MFLLASVRTTICLYAKRLVCLCTHEASSRGEKKDETRAERSVATTGLLQVLRVLRLGGIEWITLCPYLRFSLDLCFNVHRHRIRHKPLGEIQTVVFRIVP